MKIVRSSGCLVSATVDEKVMLEGMLGSSRPEEA